MPFVLFDFPKINLISYKIEIPSETDDNIVQHRFELDGSDLLQIRGEAVNEVLSTKKRLLQRDKSDQIADIRFYLEYTETDQDSVTKPKNQRLYLLDDREDFDLRLSKMDYEAALWAAAGINIPLMEVEHEYRLYAVINQNYYAFLFFYE